MIVRIEKPRTMSYGKPLVVVLVIAALIGPVAFEAFVFQVFAAEVSIASNLGEWLSTACIRHTAIYLLVAIRVFAVRRYSVPSPPMTYTIDCVSHG